MRYRRYKKRIRLQFKRWMKYSWSDQEKILSKYNVILLGHRTRREKLKALFKKSNRERNTLSKFNKYVSMIGKGINQFSKEMNNFSLNEKHTNRKARQLTEGLERMSGVNSKYRYAGLTGSSNKNYDALIGHSSKISI